MPIRKTAVSRARTAAAVLLLCTAPSSAGIIDALKSLLPAPNKAEAVDPEGYSRVTHLIVVGGETTYNAAQELILGRVEQDLASSGCWHVLTHGEVRKKFPHAPLRAPNAHKWDNSDDVSGKFLAGLPKRDDRLGVLVLWVQQWHGNVYGRENINEAVNLWLDKRLNPPGSQPVQGDYGREAEAQLFNSVTGAQLWRGHFAYPNGTPLQDGRLPYADQDVRDAQVKKEYEDFIDFFTRNLRHPPNLQNGCRELPDASTAAAVKPGAGAPLSARAQALVDLKSADAAKRAAAAKALGQPDDEEAVAPLIRALGDPDLKVRAYVLDALGMVGSAAAVEPVEARLRDKSRLLRALAARALGRIGSDRARPALESLLKTEKEPVVRAQAQQAIKRIGDPLTMKMDVDVMLPAGPGEGAESP